MRVVAIILALLLISGHTAGLQVVAWAGMFSDRLATAPSAMSALVSTLDGSRPCALCRAVSDLQDATDKPTGVLKVSKKPDSTGAVCVWQLPPMLWNGMVSVAGVRRFAVAEVPDVESPPPRG